MKMNRAQIMEDHKHLILKAMEPLRSYKQATDLSTGTFYRKPLWHMRSRRARRTDVGRLIRRLESCLGRKIRTDRFYKHHGH